MVLIYCSHNQYHDQLESVVHVANIPNVITFGPLLIPVPMASAFHHRLTEYPFGLESLGCGQIRCLLLFELGSSKKETKKLLPEGYVKACDYCVPTVRDHWCYTGHPFVSNCDVSMLTTRYARLCQRLVYRCTTCHLLKMSLLLS